MMMMKKRRKSRLALIEINRTMNSSQMPEKQLRSCSPSIVGLVPIVTTATLKTTFPNTFVTVEDTMNQNTRHLCCHIHVVSTAIRRETLFALMPDVMSYAIQEDVHHATSTCQSSVSVVKKKREFHVKYQTRQTSHVRINVENC